MDTILDLIVHSKSGLGFQIPFPSIHLVRKVERTKLAYNDWMFNHYATGTLIHPEW